MNFNLIETGVQFAKLNIKCAFIRIQRLISTKCKQMYLFIGHPAINQNFIIAIFLNIKSDLLDFSNSVDEMSFIKVFMTWYNYTIVIHVITSNSDTNSMIIDVWINSCGEYLQSKLCMYVLFTYILNSRIFVAQTLYTWAKMHFVYPAVDHEHVYDYKCRYLICILQASPSEDVQHLKWASI